ncbi:hypothetical protein D3C87_1470040 [compost metagenome]
MIKIVSAATMPESLALDPAERLTRVWAIIGQPPIPKKNPFNMFAPPWAMHSRFPLPFVPVISSTRFSVSSPSVNPTEAMINAYGKIVLNVSKFNGIPGIWNGGNPPATDAMSLTVLV